MNNLMQLALEMRTALQYFVETLDSENQLEMMLNIPSVYPVYTVGNTYKTKDVFSYGVNSVGDPQLYQVLQDHISSSELTPDTTVSLYKAIGITEDGYPEWKQPLGSTDAYNAGDIVCYKGTLYCSKIDNNVWNPETYPNGWEVYKQKK